jgi:hypothetical protein
MTEQELSTELERLAEKTHGYANDFSKRDAVKKVVAFFEAVNPADYRLLHRAIFNFDASVKEYETILPLKERLQKLADRLTEAGQETDADTCLFALSRLKSEAT